jgi:hypothetical protein
MRGPTSVPPRRSCILKSFLGGGALALPQEHANPLNPRGCPCLGCSSSPAENQGDVFWKGFELDRTPDFVASGRATTDDGSPSRETTHPCVLLQAILSAGEQLAGCPGRRGACKVSVWALKLGLSPWTGSHTTLTLLTARPRGFQRIYLAPNLSHIPISGVQWRFLAWDDGMRPVDPSGCPFSCNRRGVACGRTFEGE